jgi:lipid II:glycine glycyltransferase (peptidoglycan interpeptide bridge formation enzyme)
MLTILTHRFPLFQKKEIWFFNGDRVIEGDYTCYCYVQNNFSLPYDLQLKELTTVIDLTQPEETLFKSINTTFKYHIRKAEKLNLRFIYNINPTPADCKNLILSFKTFALQKGIIQMDKRRIYALQRSKNIIITSIKDDATNIVTHVYLFDKQRIVLMHTFHDLDYIKNKERGYANKYLHWKDMLLFKKMNFTTYDFGGIDPDKVRGISEFKLSFGGKIEEANSYIRIKPIFKFIFKLYKIIR